MSTDFVAGWVSGGVGLLAGHPFDTVKTRLQTMKGYNGMFDCFTKTLRHESVSGLYRGMFLPFLSAGAVNSLLFAGYGVALKLMHPGDVNAAARKELPMREIMVASFCGTVAQLPLMIPVEAIKTKLQVQQETSQVTAGRKLSSGPWQCARQVVAAKGMKGLYQGGNMVVLRELFTFSFYIPLYEVVLRTLRNHRLDETLAQFLAGGTAGVVTWLTVCPLEVVKNRMLVNTSNPKSAGDTFRSAYRSEGARTFFKGGLALSVYGFLTNAALFMVYEKCYAFLETGKRA